MAPRTIPRTIPSEIPAEILDGFYFIERGYLNANHFVYKSANPVLVDTGFVARFDDTVSAIESLGMSISDVSLIITTHCHCDHVGGHGAIQELSGCDIALSALGKEWMDAKNDWDPWWRPFNQQAVFFDATRVLEEGEEVAIGPHVWKVIYTPGHARDQIALYNERARMLISADALWEQDIPSMPVHLEGEDSLENALLTLEKLGSLKVNVVFPGHGSPFTDVVSAIAQTRKRIEAYIEQPEKIGRDLVKKGIVFTIMRLTAVREESFLLWLMDTPWYPDICERYLGGDCEGVYKAVMERFKERGIVVSKCGMLTTPVKA